jgi:hypothetical protein
MFPGMVFLILSRDADFVAEMKAMLEGRGCAVYVAANAREARRTTQEANKPARIVSAAGEGTKQQGPRHGVPRAFALILGRTLLLLLLQQIQEGLPLAG